MRQVVGTLLEHEQLRPQPSLSQLNRLLEHAGPADIHFHSSGRPRSLPAGVELTIYRTLEHLLDAFSGAPGSPVDVNVDFADEVLSLTVRGPTPAAMDLQAALTAAQARIEVHHGFLASDCLAGRWEATARLPL